MSSESKILKKSLQQKFSHCSSNATLFVSQKETPGSAIFLFPLYRKTVVVKCDITGQEILKKEWNEQTKIEAKNLLKEYPLTKKGWYFFLGSFAIVFVLLAILGVSEIFNVKASQKSFVSKTREEQKKLLAKLDTGDLIKTYSAVYKVVSVNNGELTVMQSSIKPNMKNINNLIKEEKYPENSFLQNTTVKINRTSFLNNSMLNTNLNDEFGGEPIAQVLDR